MGHCFSYQTKIKKDSNLLILKNTAILTLLWLTNRQKNKNKTREALSRFPRSWLMRISQRARGEKSSSRHTRKAKKRARVASFSYLSTCRLTLMLFNLCYSTNNYDSWECDDDILRETSFFQPYSEVLMILHIR